MHKPLFHYHNNEPNPGWPDPLGQAIRDYYWRGENAYLTVFSDIAETDYWETAYFFRNLSDMPHVEHAAIEYARGKVLDIGAGAGCHLLPLVNKGCQPFALETSAGAVEVLKHSHKNEQVFYADYFHFEPSHSFDTLFLMMNGIGICESIDGFRTFLDKAFTLLPEDGQILMDSFDLTYLLDEEGLETRIAELDQYFGEVKYQLCYKTIHGSPFNWLFMDPEVLRRIAESKGWQVALPAFEKGHFLARLTL